MNYINQIFLKYDTDRTGSLDCAQLAHFFTDVYASMGQNIAVNYYQAQQALVTIDANHDGRADKR